LIMKETISNKRLREFGVLIGFGFPILIGWLLPSFFGHEYRLLTLWFVITSILISSLNPRLLCIPYLFFNKAWNTFYSLLIIALLWVTYIIFVNPTSLILRLLGYDPLKRKFNEAKSYGELKRQKTINFDGMS